MVDKKIVDEVLDERTSQDLKWGVQNHESYKWLTILGEEFGEACKAALELDFSIGEKFYAVAYRKELIQVAAVAIAALESFDRSLKGG